MNGPYAKKTTIAAPRIAGPINFEPRYLSTTQKSALKMNMAGPYSKTKKRSPTTKKHTQCTRDKLCPTCSGVLAECKTIK
jgi:hypothetical protein